MELLTTYIPMDRRQAMFSGEILPDRAEGAALVADISGFTPLTEALVQELGRRRGADELTRHLNRVCETLIAEVHRYRGSVIGFSGDAITCWFDGDEGLRATACALAMQAVMGAFAALETPAGTKISLAIKTIVTAGPARRFLVGQPQIQYLDVLIGHTLDRLAVADSLAMEGEVLVGPEVLSVLGYRVVLLEWRQTVEGGQRFAVIAGLADKVYPQATPWPLLPPLTTVADSLPEADLRPWSVLPVSDSEPEAFRAELRRVVALFLRFSGIDYDGDDAAGEKLKAYIGWTQKILAGYGGYLIQLTTGDKGVYFYAVFGAPTAHADDAIRAVAAALELRSVPPAFDFIDTVQIGLSQGRMRTGAYGSPERRTYGVLGNEVNLAARLMTMAQPGQILVSKHVAEAAEPTYQFKYLGVANVKGKQAPVPVFITRNQSQPVMQRPDTLFTTPLVGRDEELKQMSHILEIAAQGKGQILRLEGVAGMGKSHLAAEFVEQALERGFQVASGACQNIGRNLPHYPWRQIFRALFGISDGMVVGQNRAIMVAGQIAQVEALINQINSNWGQHLPLLGDLLGLPIADNATTTVLNPEVRQGILFSVVADMLQTWAQSQPLLLLLEDIHWLDEASQALILALHRVIAKSPILLVLVQRPPDVEAGGQALLADLDHLFYHHRLKLDELSVAGIEALVANRLQGQLSPLALALIQANAQGNPFFTEELVDALYEAGHLYRRDDGILTISEPILKALHEANCLEKVDETWHLVDQAPLTALDLGLPDAVHGLVLSRIDRLPEAHKLTLKVASVIGRIFEISLLVKAHPVEFVSGALSEQIKGLERHDFIRLEMPAPHLAYKFKHHITQEAVYETLLFEQRRQLHGLVAHWYEQIFGAETAAGLESPLAPYYALLVYHWHQAEDKERERHYARLTGQYAAAQFANAEAIRYFSRALDLTPETAYAERYALLLDRESVHDLQGDREAQAKDLNALERLATQLSDNWRRAEVATRQANYYNLIGNYQTAIEIARLAITLAQSGQSLVSEATGYLQWGIALWHQGDFQGAHPKLEAALALAESAQLRPVEADCLRNLGIVASFLGDPAGAKRYYEQVMHICGEIGSRWNYGRALGNFGFTAWSQGDYVNAKIYAQQSLAICREVGDRRGEGLALLYLAMLALEQGDPLQAKMTAEEALQITQEISSRWEEGLISAFLSLLSHRQDDHETAQVYSKRALLIGQSLGDTFIMSYALMSLGHALAGLGQVTEAIAAYQQVLGLQRVLDEAQVVIEPLAGLARVFLDQGHLKQAQQQVEEILRRQEDRTLAGTFEPFRTYLTCYQVLTVNEDSRAQTILRTAYNHLQERAAEITDESARQRFLSEVREHQTLISTWEAEKMMPT